MARIRTIKPEFFQHEALQDLESQHPELHPMLVFAGLWGHCDKRGVFEWKPRTLKLHILPFLTFEMEDALSLLEQAGQLESFENSGRKFGHIPTFEDHQRIGGKEHSDPAKYPEAPSKQLGSIGEASGQQLGLQEGKGREGKGSGRERNGREGKGTTLAPVDNSAAPTSESGEDFSGEGSPLKEPSPRTGTGERRNGDFEAINAGVSKLLSSGGYVSADTRGLARALHCSVRQVEVAIEQLRDRGQLPTRSAA